MKWTDEQIRELKEPCYAGTSNADIAKQIGVPLTEIYAGRESQQN